jgi:hypothetical protein
MPKLKRETLETLAGIGDADRANILALFDECAETEIALAGLRAKVPTDSQKVVDSVEFDKLKETAAKNEELKKQLAEQMERFKLDSTLDPLVAFRPLVNFLSSGNE